MKEKHWYFSKKKWMADPENAEFHYMRWPNDANGERVLNDFFETNREGYETGITEINGYHVIKEWCVYK